MKVKFGNMENKTLQTILKCNKYIILNGETKICKKMVGEIFIQFLRKQIVHEKADYSIGNILGNEYELELDDAGIPIYEEKFLRLILLRVFGV